MFGITNSGKLFSDELTNWLIYVAGLKNQNVKISNTTSIHQMDPIWLYYLVFMTVYFWYTFE